MGQMLQRLQSAGTGLGGVGPVNQAMALNSPTPQMQNTAMGMDPTQGAVGAAPFGQQALNGKTQMTPPTPNPTGMPSAQSPTRVDGVPQGVAALPQAHTMNTLPVSTNPFANSDPRTAMARQLFQQSLRGGRRTE